MADALCHQRLFLSSVISVLFLSIICWQPAAQAETIDAAPVGTFSIVIIPDTQRYKTVEVQQEGSGRKVITNAVFEKWTDWIAANLMRQNIVLVSHVGDIVDINNHDQWRVAKRCMNKLHGRVPYGISVGNHDMTSDGNAQLFQEYFPQQLFTNFDWYGGCFERESGNPEISVGNVNSVQLFEASGMKFVALHLECNAPDDVLNWASSILKLHHERRAIITTHMGLGPRDKPKTAEDFFNAQKGRMTWTKRHGSRGNSPQEMWEKCFSQHQNVFMICCGDQSRTQAMRLQSKGIHGNVVHELLSDYGYDGLRVMRFIPNENRIEVQTYDPVKDKLCLSTSIVKDAEQHQFILSYRMSANSAKSD